MNKRKKKVILVAGARPNFMKIAPLWRELKKYPAEFQPLILHTGQHYDTNMSDVFFRDLQLPAPDICLGVGSGTLSQQTAAVMVEFEKTLEKEKPDLVVVVGDVNSTLAASLATVQCRIRKNSVLPLLAHVEAGLRSFDRTMPEEINRTLTDSLSDYLFTTTADDNKNLLREGVSPEKFFLVGDIMVDSLRFFLRRKNKSRGVLKEFGLQKSAYAVLTLHRPSNVDSKETLAKLTRTFCEISKTLPIVFPCHPRTAKNLEVFGLKDTIQKSGLILTKPLGYLDFIYLISNSRLVITDSGSLQTETAVLGIPCLTLRKNTERPITVTKGAAVLIGNNSAKLKSEVAKIMAGKGKKPFRIPLWDGKTAARIVSVLRRATTWIPV
ncbi:MAG: UDP-N-acetylglucosamine 2-epimerase (non-hydrolyzing) [Candidatus Omnitrophota bacterium]